MSEAPDVIYLQWIPEKSWYDDTVTWCEDEINDDDIEYIKKSTVTHQKKLLRKCKELFERDVIIFWPGDNTEMIEKLAQDIAGELKDG